MTEGEWSIKVLRFCKVRQRGGATKAPRVTALAQTAWAVHHKVDAYGHS